MKNQQTVITQTGSNLTEQKPKGIKCKKNGIAKFACTSKICTKYAFICEKEDCGCQEDHESCCKTIIKSIVKSLEKKIVSLKPLEECINIGIDVLIDQLSALKDKLLDYIKQSLKYTGLNQNQAVIIKSIKQQKVSSITGQQIWKANLTFLTHDKTRNQINQTSKRITNLFQKIYDSIGPVKIQLENLNKFVDDRADEGEGVIVEKAKLGSLSALTSSNFFNKSKIVSTFDQKASLIFFLSPDSLYKTTLLYRASQNSFSTSKFHQMCDGIQNTLVLCQTSHQKIIGGYTHLIWNYFSQSQSRQSISYSDPKGKSFIFSLTNKDKFVIQNYQKKGAITHWKKQKNYGPSFGEEQDFVIADQANMSAKSYCNLNKTYYNSNYGKLKQNGYHQIIQTIDYSKFHGGQKKTTFQLVEWEVWQIKFE